MGRDDRRARHCRYRPHLVTRRSSRLLLAGLGSHDDLHDRHALPAFDVFNQISAFCAAF